MTILRTVDNATGTVDVSRSCLMRSWRSYQKADKVGIPPLEVRLDRRPYTTARMLQTARLTVQNLGFVAAPH